MKGNRSLFIAVGVVAVLILGWWLFGRGGGASALNLIDRFETAEKRPPAPGVFSIEDVTINGETKKAIAVKPSIGTRLTFKTRVPDDGWLRVSVAMKPEAWTQEGDGVRFMALVRPDKFAELEKDVGVRASEQLVSEYATTLKS